LARSAPRDGGVCVEGHAPECWRDCFRRSSGSGCRLLGGMFLTGNGVSRDIPTAHRLYTLACNLGECSPREPWPSPVATPTPGRVSSPGSVVVYGNFNGNVYVGR
jgi:hypothetical protein